MSRRSRFALIVPLVLLAAWFGVKAWVRGHVDDLIQHAVGAPLPTFALADQDGRVWRNADLLGQRVVLHFFRSACGACVAEAPALRELEAALPPDTVLLHVMTDRVLGFPPEQTAATLRHDGFRAPVLMADQPFVDSLHSVRWSNVTPVTYVVDATGTVRFGLRGTQSRASIEAALAAAR